MFTADAHCDTLHVMIKDKYPDIPLTVTADRLKKGDVRLQTFALFSGRKEESGTAKTRCERMLKLVDKLGVPIYRGALPETVPDEPHGVLSVEGGEALEGSISFLHEIAGQGVRMIALTWNYENEIGWPGINMSKEGLKPFGRELIREMDNLGVLTDVSHLNDAGFYDVASITRLPIVASHSNSRDVTDVTRNLTSDQVKTIIQSHGFIGINFYSKFLAKDRPATIDDIFRHIDALCEMGAEKNIGFGSDFDGIDEWPDGIENPTCFPRLIDLLKEHGYSDETVRGFAGMNLWRVYKEAGFK